MDTHSEKFKIRLGIFVTIGILIFVLAIFAIGKQKNIFDPVFQLKSTFNNVSGLQVGNNVRFSGINVGTVDKISIVNDSTVEVEMLIRKNVQQFIKTDSRVSIGSEGIIGDRIIVVSQGSPVAPNVEEGHQLISAEPVETDAIFAGLQVTVENTQIVSHQLAEILYKINNGNGILGRLIQDSVIAANFHETMVNLKRGTKGLDENMKAAQSNFLLKGYFNKKEKEAERLKKETEKRKEEEEKLRREEEERKLKEQKKKAK